MATRTIATFWSSVRSSNEAATLARRVLGVTNVALGGETKAPASAGRRSSSAAAIGEIGLIHWFDRQY